MYILEYFKIIIKFFIGNDTNLLSTLLILQLFDIITGFMYGKKTKSHKSGIFVNGIFKKIACLISIMVTKIIDNYFNMNNTLLVLCFNYFIFYEIFSVIENLKKLDINFFDNIKGIIENQKNKKGLK